MQQYDVLVIGGGGAGLRAAIAAKESRPELKVAVMTKGTLGESGVTATACSDRMAYHATLKHTEPGGDDAWKYHAEDIYRIGGLVSDADLAAILARNAGDSFYYLDSLGVPFAKVDGFADQFVTDGSVYARACYTGPHTANHIEEALVRRIGQLPVEILNETMAAEAIKEGDRVVGVLAVSTRTQEMFVIGAKAVIIASGGPGGLFSVNVFPEGMTGDGQAIALRAGAELVNMEFIQIGLSSVKTKLACSGSMFRALPRLVNSDGEEFLPKYYKGDYPSMYETLFKKGASWPVSKEEPSHIIDIAVAKENGRGKKVYLDYSANPVGLDLRQVSGTIRAYNEKTKGERIDLYSPEVLASPLVRLKKINAPAVEWLRERGIDLDNGDRIELAPAIQHFQGGIKIRRTANTCVPGLYAAGEAAGGQHGANRPGGNALMDSQVFGKIAGEAAAAYAQTAPAATDLEAAGEMVIEIASRKTKSCAGCPGGCSSKRMAATEAREKLTAAMSRAAAVVRTEAELNEALAVVNEIRAARISAEDNGVAFACETLNMLDSAEAVLTACLDGTFARV